MSRPSVEVKDAASRNWVVIFSREQFRNYWDGMALFKATLQARTDNFRTLSAIYRSGNHKFCMLDWYRVEGKEVFILSLQ